MRIFVDGFHNMERSHQLRINQSGTTVGLDPIQRKIICCVIQGLNATIWNCSCYQSPRLHSTGSPANSNDRLNRYKLCLV